VIGSLYRLEGAWLGAFAYVYINNEVQYHNWSVPWLGGTFNTIIGVIFLVIVLLSPGGLLGIWETGTNWIYRFVLSPSRLVAAGTGSTAAPPAKGAEP